MRSAPSSILQSPSAGRASPTDQLFEEQAAVTFVKAPFREWPTSLPALPKKVRRTARSKAIFSALYPIPKTEETAAVYPESGVTVTAELSRAYGRERSQFQEEEVMVIEIAEGISRRTSPAVVEAFTTIMPGTRAVVPVA